MYEPRLLQGEPKSYGAAARRLWGGENGHGRDPSRAEAPQVQASHETSEGAVFLWSIDQEGGRGMWYPFMLLHKRVS